MDRQAERESRRKSSDAQLDCNNKIIGPKTAGIKFIYVHNLDGSHDGPDMRFNLGVIDWSINHADFNPHLNLIRCQKMSR